MGNNNALILSEDWNIDMKDAWQVLWWCRCLGITKSQLERAIHAVGSLIADIRHYVVRQHATATELPVVPVQAGAGIITSRYALNRSPF